MHIMPVALLVSSLTCTMHVRGITRRTDHDLSGELLAVDAHDMHMTHGSLGPVPSFAP